MNDGAMIYRDSLSRMYGAPGSCKSFLALDIALSLAAGKFFNGRRLDPETVCYVMAEGQRVNGDRVEAWMSKHHVSLEQLDGRFYAVPDAVLLTEHAARPFIEWVKENQPALVVLDTKNAMMIGEENSASDFAAMRRTLDLIRTASGCCVMLIDHTGYAGNRARGSSAGTAAMDTEIRVTKNEDRPALITAEVTRDKAAEAGLIRAWRLVPHHPAAVLEPCDLPGEDDATAQAEAANRPEWLQATREEDVPRFVAEMPDGPRKVYLVALARYFLFETSMEQDPSRIGRTRAQAVMGVTPPGSDTKAKEAWRQGVARAWSQLKDRGCLECAIADPTDTQEASGLHLWTGPTP